MPVNKSSKSLQELPSEIKSISNEVVKTILKLFAGNVKLEKEIEGIFKIEYNKYTGGPVYIKIILLPMKLTTFNPAGDAIFAALDLSSVKIHQEQNPDKSLETFFNSLKKENKYELPMGYDATIFFNAEYSVKLLTERINNALFVKNDEIQRKMKENPARYSVWTLEAQLTNRLTEIITHELAHALDPAIIIPYLKTNQFKQNYNDPELNQTVRMERYLLSDEEMTARFRTGFETLFDIIVRAYKNNYVNEIKYDIIEAIDRIKKGNYDMKDLDSLARIPVNLVAELKRRKNLRYKTWTLKLIKSLQIALNLIEKFKPNYRKNI